ncbi:hypothetical protein [Tenacibaculum halocynthiae]|uniref:hypothetical protein n=1 Tax=Tenacibaculum halocynthiae TaxID=1254437 RepID=UPI0038960872
MFNNQKLVEVLKAHLNGTSSNAVHAIKVACNGIKLAKKSGTRRFAFTKNDIEQKYATLPAFLEELPVKGFKENVQFTLLKMYTRDNKTTYHTVAQLTENLTAENMESKSPTMNHYSTPTPQMVPQGGMNFLGAPEFMNKMVDADRVNDYKKRLSDLEEDLKNLRSDNRGLREKNNSLEIQLATSKDREELRIERVKMDVKGWHESPAFDKTMEALGGIIPKVLEVVQSKNQVPAQLGNPNLTLSPTKQGFLEKIQSESITDQQIGLFNYLLSNWNKNFVDSVLALIEKKENHEDSE